MLTTAVEEIFNYWNELRGDRPAPLRSDVNPARLRHFLPHLFLVAFDPDAELRFTLAGTRICELFDKELRGTAFADLWLAEADYPGSLVREVIQCEQVALMEVNLFATGKPYLHDMLLMPLRTTEGYSDRMLGTLLPRSTAISSLLFPAEGIETARVAFGPRGLSSSDSDKDHESPPQIQPFLRRLVSKALLASASR